MESEREGIESESRRYRDRKGRDGLRLRVGGREIEREEAG